MRCLETRSTVSLASVSRDHVQMIPMSLVPSCIDIKGHLELQQTGEARRLHIEAGFC